MLLFSSITGILLSLILLSFTVRKYKATIYLSLFFLLISLYGIAVYALMYSKSVTLVSIFYFNISFLAFIVGPLLYWYVRSVLTDDAHLKKLDLWHFIPVIIFLLDTLSYMFSPYSDKLEIASRIVEDPNFLREYKPSFLYHVMPISAYYLLRPIHIFAYTIWASVLYIRYLTQKSKSWIISRQYFMVRWLPCLLGILPLGLISHIIHLSYTFSIQESNIFYSLDILQLLSQAGFLGLLVSPFFFPRILYGIPRVPESIWMSKNEEEVSNEEEVPIIEDRIKHTPHYENLYLISIRQRIDDCMEANRPFLKSDFNITQLSVMTKIPVHHLAYFFREVKNQSFCDYRNEWRISYAKNLIMEGKTAMLTLEAIGLLSGFPSRNAFINAFKKCDGIAPGAFASQAAK